MTRNAWLLIGLGGAAALLVFSRTKVGEQAVADVADTAGESVGIITSAVRGIRNKNPGNIRKSADKWRGLSARQNDPAFFQFDSMIYGVRAIVMILRNYSAKYGIDTVAGLINRWAPSSENNTSAYVRAVAGYVGAQPDDRLDLWDDETIAMLVRAIIRHENGILASTFVSDSDIAKGIAAA